jgi:hypothetical protein
MSVIVRLARYTHALALVDRRQWLATGVDDSFVHQFYDLAMSAARFCCPDLVCAALHFGPLFGSWQWPCLANFANGY